MAKLRQAAIELLPEEWVDFEGRALLNEIIANTGEDASLHAVREPALAALDKLLRERVTLLEADPTIGRSQASKPPRAPDSLTKQLWPVFGVLGVTVVVGALAMANRTQRCADGLRLRDGQCVKDTLDPVEQYAACILRDAKSSTSTDKGTSFQLKVDQAKVGASSALEVKDKFERSVEANTDRCVVLDVSARCFALATGNTKQAPVLPASCLESKDGTNPEPVPTHTGVQAGTGGSRGSPRACAIDGTTFNLAQKCAGKSTTRKPTHTEATQLASTHGQCDTFVIVSCSR